MICVNSASTVDIYSNSLYDKQNKIMWKKNKEKIGENQLYVVQ